MLPGIGKDERMPFWQMAAAGGCSFYIHTHIDNCSHIILSTLVEYILSRERPKSENATREHCTDATQAAHGHAERDRCMGCLCADASRPR